MFLGLEGQNADVRARYFRRTRSGEQGPIAGLGHFRERAPPPPLLPIKDAAIMGQAKAMIDWHNATASAPLRRAHRRRLTKRATSAPAPNCKAEHFPRTDPVVIMLATHGDALPRRPQQAISRAACYSALAGFIEPGETIEEAVERELMEEVA